MKSINILGTVYALKVKKYDEDDAFESRQCDGYCDGYAKEIVVCDMRTHKNWQGEQEQTIQECQKSVLRHEIVHAFLNESGLMASSFVSDRGWALNEEMVDWISLQGKKIYDAWRQTECV